jgi:hypothetical protein
MDSGEMGVRRGEKVERYLRGEDGGWERRKEEGWEEGLESA